MDLKSLINTAQATNLLRFLDLSLPNAAAVALLGIARGFNLLQLRHLPGLRNPKRLREVLEFLVGSERVCSTGTGHVALETDAPDPHALRGALATKKKLARTLEFLATSGAGLYARGMSGLAAALGAELGEALERALTKLDALEEQDREFLRRQRLSRLHYVVRNVPRGLLEVTEEGPRPRRAPSNLVDLTVDALAGTSGADRRQEWERRVTKLYVALLPYGEGVLAHWWAILDTVAARGLTGSAFWTEWRSRLESYLLQHRIVLGSPELRFRELEPRLLRQRFPIPECGYGPWVDYEVALWRGFSRRYGPSMGPLTKDLWLRTHEAVAAQLREEYEGAELGMVGRERYEERLQFTADTLSGLPGPVLEDLSRRQNTRRVKAARRHAERKIAALQERVAVRKAVKCVIASEDTSTRQTADTLLAVRQRIDLTDTSEGNWAPRLLHAVARKEAGDKVDQEEFADLIEAAAQWKNRGGRRWRHRRLSERVLSALDYSFKVRPVHVAPGGGCFPVELVRAHVRKAMSRIADADVTAEDRAAAQAAVFEYLRNRACIEVVYSPGTSETRTVSDACRLTGRSEIAEDILGLVQPSRRAA